MLGRFDDLLLSELKNPRFAAAYLNEHLSYVGPDSWELLLSSLGKIARAQGYSELARRSGVSRRTIYYAFAPGGNPSVETLFGLLRSIGLSVRFRASRKRAA
jgi:probable addiction module antidote protein